VEDCAAAANAPGEGAEQGRILHVGTEVGDVIGEGEASRRGFVRGGGRRAGGRGRSGLAGVAAVQVAVFVAAGGAGAAFWGGGRWGGSWGSPGGRLAVSG
jgi:hypothetical protein